MTCARSAAGVATFDGPSRDLRDLPGLNGRIGSRRGAAARRAVPLEIVTIEREDVIEIGLVASDDPASGDRPILP